MKGNTVQGVVVLSMCCQETSSVHMNTFWTLWLNLLPQSVYSPHPKKRSGLPHIHMHKKKNLIWVFSEISVGCRREYHAIAWKGQIDFVIQSETKQNRFSIPPSWFMNNLISLPANHGVASHDERATFSPRRSQGPSSSHLYFTSTVDCSLHFQHNVWTKIVEEILPSAGPSIIRAAQAMKYRPGPTNNESYLVC